MAKRVPFGGYKVNFSGVADMTLGEVFGTGDVLPSQMTKKIWDLIKRKGLASK